MAEFAPSLLGFVLTLMLVLLGLAWLGERLGAWRKPGWSELAWRGALIGSVLTATLVSLPRERFADAVAAWTSPAAQPVPITRAAPADRHGPRAPVVVAPHPVSPEARRET